MSIQLLEDVLISVFTVISYNPVHNRRTVEHFFDEVQMLADLGIKRFEFIDDIFNVNRKSCKAFFEKL